jgi:hypothetical protein
LNACPSPKLPLPFDNFKGRLVEKGKGGAKVVVVPPIFDSERAPGQRLEALEIRERERESERERERERER